MTQLANNAQRRGEPTPGVADRNAVPPIRTAPVSTSRRSWSQYNNLRDCAKRWWLEKKRGAPRRPGVWLSAGSAVHMVIEAYLLEKAREESGG